MSGQEPKKERSFATYDLTVESTELISPRNKHIRFRLPEGASIRFQAGQFIQMFIPLADGKVRRTSYSIASAPSHSDYFELCVTHVEGGVSSTYLHGLKPGDKIQGMGPLGTFRFVDEGRDAVFVATGSGIAPFRAMIHDLLEKKTTRGLYLLFGNRYEANISYRKDWEETAARHPNFKAYFTLSRDTAWTGPKGYVQDHIEPFVPEPASKDYYICGLKNMTSAVEQKLLSLGVPKERIRFERYD
jgi:ferredoxin-NADP reductase